MRLMFRGATLQLVGGSHLRHFDVDAALAAEADEPDGSCATGMVAGVSPDSLAAPVLVNHPRVRPGFPVACLQQHYAVPPAR
jgi:hypothetical protein